MKNKLPEVKHILNYKELEDLILGYKGIDGVRITDHQLESGRNIYNIEYGTGNKKVISVCGLHANERTAIQFWWKSLNKVIEEGLPENTKYSLVTPANPDGMVRDERWNDNGADLNRDWRDFSQLETRIIKEIIDKESKGCQTIVFDHHESHDEPLYFLEDPGSEHMDRIRDTFFEELYKEAARHKIRMTDFGAFWKYTNRHIAQAARSGQLINYTAPKGTFSLIAENMGQFMGEEDLDRRMQVHASVDLAGLRAWGSLR